MHSLKKNEIRILAIYFLIIVVAVFIHELGHTFVAWINGMKAIPTPAKEYLIGNASPELNRSIALGGIIGSFIITLLVMIIYSKKPTEVNAAIFAGTLAPPGVYSFLFFIKGRGHDATEFQDAQSALGLNYSGHFIDWFFVALFIFGSFLWVIKSKPTIKIIPRLLLGFVLTFLFIVVLQSLNNSIFDPIFNQK